MADNKQPQLNGGYYGPAIPPADPPHQQQHRSRRHHHHRVRKCCCCFLIFIGAIIVFLVLVVAVYWIVVEPRGFRFHVTDAKLTRFNLTTANNNNNNVNTLHYNLVLNFTVRNPNKRLNFYYDHVEGHVYYGGVRFASADVLTWQNAFRQHAKSTDNSSMSGVFAGEHVMAPFDHVQVKDFEEDNKSGVFDIDVRLYFKIRFRLGDLVTNPTKARAKCELQVPLVSKGVFDSTGCSVKL